MDDHASHPVMVSFYDRVNAPRPHYRPMPWGDLCDVLRRVRPVRGDKADREAGLALWSPVRLRQGTTRANRNVLSVSCLVLDYDDGTELHDALDRWDGYERLVHTSWSHAPDAPRCRLVMPLSEPVNGEDWGPVIAWMMTIDGQEADTVCKDAARQFYLPAVGRGGPHAFLHRKGRLLDVARVVALTREIRAQEEAEHRARRQEAQRKIQREVADSDQRDREARKALECDPDARARLGQALGGRSMRRQDGEVFRGVACPACGRHSVWWLVDPHKWRGAACEHRNSCGWTGRLYDLALLG